MRTLSSAPVQRFSLLLALARMLISLDGRRSITHDGESKVKGKTSKRLESVLGDPTAREQLRSTLISGRDGRVTAGSKQYTVSTTVKRDSQTGKFVTQTSRKRG